VTFQPYPPAPPPPPPGGPGGPGSDAGWSDGWRHAPRELRPVVVLLAVNLTLSILLTVLTLALRHSLVEYQLDHRHVTDPAQRAAVRQSYTAGIVGRAVGNIVVSVVYAFLVRALLRGRRWAYRRVIWLGAAGIVGLVLIQLTPYPVWMRIEQLVQAVVLALLVWFVTRPAVRAHFAPGLPGRDKRRFRG
jgi:hypothetical protein